MTTPTTPVYTHAVSNFKIILPGEFGTLTVNVPANHFSTMTAFLNYAGLLATREPELQRASQWILLPLTYQLKRDGYPNVDCKDLAVKLNNTDGKSLLQFYPTNTNYRGGDAEPLRVIDRMEFTQMVGIHLGDGVRDVEHYAEWVIDSYHADNRICWWRNTELNQTIVYDTETHNTVHSHDRRYSGEPQFMTTLLDTPKADAETVALFKETLKRIS